MSVLTPAFSLKPVAQIRTVDSRNQSDACRVILQSDGPGLLEVPEQDGASIAIHVGRPVRLDCRPGAKRNSELAIHGDVDIIPEGIACSWEMKEPDTALLVKIEPQVLRRVREECALSGRPEILSQFRLRDSEIEHIGWALLAEVRRGYPNGHLYMDSLAPHWPCTCSRTIVRRLCGRHCRREACLDTNCVKYSPLSKRTCATISRSPRSLTLPG